jgi:hypothetical protein
MPSYYHIMIIPKQGADRHDIEEAFNLALDWFRFHSTMWVIYTNKDAETWYHRLKGFVQPGGHLFVCKLDVSDRHGWLPRAFWDWVQERQTGESEASHDRFDPLAVEEGLSEKRAEPSKT